MYLYNGHRAPGLPVYDPGELPYGLIVSANADNTALILMLCVNRPYYGVNPQDSTKTGVYNTGRMLVYTCTDTDEAWTFAMETDNPLTANDDDPGGGVLWTLGDILKTDGSVWMAGTQPVPEQVTEAWVRSFLEGLALGLNGNPLPYTGTEPAPEAVAYLYGTHSESGNVAVAEGDGYVRYKGAVLPPLPETAYQYAVIGLYYPGGGTHRHMLCCTNLPLRDGSFMFNKPEGCVGFSYMYDEDDEDYEDWHLAEDWSDGKPFLLPSDPIWANYDFLNYAGTAVSVKASDPIPLASAEPVAAVYGSEKLPLIDTLFTDEQKEQYPYVLIMGSTQSWNDAYSLFRAKSPIVWTGAHLVPNSDDRECLYARRKTKDDPWEVGPTHSLNSNNTVHNFLVWADHDILSENEDEPPYFTTSDPTPIYQKKE